MPKYVYCVITEVPKPWEGNDGNLGHVSFSSKGYPDSYLYIQNNTYGGSNEGSHESIAVSDEAMRLVAKAIGKRHWKEFSFTAPVFELGEICILNEHLGREVAGKQRAPRKWFIEYEEFTNLDNAVARAREVLRQEELMSHSDWYLKEGGKKYITAEERKWLKKQLKELS